MRYLHKNQQLILEFLLQNKDGATLDEIAAHLGITKTAAKEHLLKVQSHGYISFADSKGSVGRPRRKYFLSTEGHDAFPKQYSWLSNALLEELAKSLGGEGISSLMETMAETLASAMSDRLKNLKTSAERLTHINSIMNELGYQTSIKQKDIRKGAIIEATNCVYHSVAKKHPELCTFDVKFLEKTSNLDVNLESCIAKGGSVCRFCLK